MQEGRKSHCREVRFRPNFDLLTSIFSAAPGKRAGASSLQRRGTRIVQWGFRLQSLGSSPWRLSDASPQATGGEQPPKHEKKYAKRTQKSPIPPPKTRITDQNEPKQTHNPRAVGAVAARRNVRTAYSIAPYDSVTVTADPADRILQLRGFVRSRPSLP